MGECNLGILCPSSLLGDVLRERGEVGPGGIAEAYEGWLLWVDKGDTGDCGGVAKGIPVGHDISRRCT